MQMLMSIVFREFRTKDKELGNFCPRMLHEDFEFRSCNLDREGFDTFDVPLGFKCSKTLIQSSRLVSPM